MGAANTLKDGPPQIEPFRRNNRGQEQQPWIVENRSLSAFYSRYPTNPKVEQLFLIYILYFLRKHLAFHKNNKSLHSIRFNTHFTHTHICPNKHMKINALESVLSFNLIILLPRFTILFTILNISLFVNSLNLICLKVINFHPTGLTCCCLQLYWCLHAFVGVWMVNAHTWMRFCCWQTKTTTTTTKQRKL